MSAAVIALCLANKNRIVSYNFNVFPTNSYSFPFAANSPVFRSSVDNQGNYSSAAGINLNITHKSQPTAVRLIYNFFASQLRYAAIHYFASNHTPILYVEPKPRMLQQKAGRLGISLNRPALKAETLSRLCPASDILNHPLGMIFLGFEEPVL